MQIGHELTAWTIRLAMAAFVVTATLSVSRPRKVDSGSGRYRFARFVWTVGCLLMFGHLAAAFHFYHDWSHHLAWLDTAKQTKELMGWAFGGGIYFSYAFTALWAADVMWWWMAPAAYLGRPIWSHATIWAYLSFIALNGTVVFETGVMRWVGLVVVSALIAYLVYQYRRSSTADTEL